MDVTRPMPGPARATPLALRWPVSGPGEPDGSIRPLVPSPGLLRLVRWGLAGGGSLALQLALQSVLIQALALPAQLGIVVAYELALVAHFFVNDRWVFAPQHCRSLPSRGVAGGPRQRGRRGQLRRLGEFHASALTAEAVTLAVAFLLLSGPAPALLGPALTPLAATIAGTLA